MAKLVLNTGGCTCALGLLARKNTLQHVLFPQQTFLGMLLSSQMCCVLSATCYFPCAGLGDLILLQNTSSFCSVFKN